MCSRGSGAKLTFLLAVTPNRLLGSLSNDNGDSNENGKRSNRLRACLHGGGGPQTGEVTCGGLPHLSSKHDQIETRDYMNRRVTPPKRFTSPNWGPPPKEQLCALFCTFLCRHCMIMQERCVHIRTYARGLLVEI